jgi:hypothetical protein
MSNHIDQLLAEIVPSLIKGSMPPQQQQQQQQSKM